MTSRKMEFTPKNLTIYTTGAIIIAFAVVMMKRSNIGLSSWDTLHFSINQLTGMTFGTAVIIVAAVFTVFVTVANKHIKYFLMFVPIFFVGLVIDFFDLYLFVNYLPEGIILRITTYALGLTLLPFGGSMLIISTFPAGVFDEFMLTMMRLFKTNKMILVRVIMEMTAVATALILGYFASIGFGMVNIGTLIFSVSVGMFVQAYLKLFEKFGMYEIEHTDNSNV